MTKQRIILLVTGVLVVGMGLTLSYLKLKSDSHRKITFEECKKAGGTAWAVDVFHPEICPACAEFRSCEEQNKDASDLRQACPQAVQCDECLVKNFPYPDRCPDGLQKIGEITDAAIWFQCCR